jgi:sodium-dependent dicarboxylate transporter 2/3/5
VAGLDSAKNIFASYGHPIIFLFIGSFLLAEAMVMHGLDRRMAAWMLSRSWVGARPDRILLALGGATALISMWMSNTAATALMLPIGLGILGTIQTEPSINVERYRIGLLLMLSYAATAGGLATLIGTPPNLIGVGLIALQTNIDVSFVKWLEFGLPLAVLMLLTAWGLLRWLHPPPAPILTSLAQSVRRQRLELGRWSRGQINTCLVFAFAVCAWVFPGLLTAVFGPGNRFIVFLESHLTNELVAVIAAGLLFVLPTDLSSRTFTLSWKQAGNINWGIILLFGGGLAFGELMMKTGLSYMVGHGFVALFGTHSLWGLTAVSIATGVVVSELASNTASATLLIPIIISIAQAADLSPVPPALGTCLGASLGFALPVSTPPNAIVYGTGLVPMGSMVRAGILYDLLGAILIWIVLRILCPVIGLA